MEDYFSDRNDCKDGEITLFTRSLGGENYGCEGIQNADVVNSYLKSIYTCGKLCRFR